MRNLINGLLACRPFARWVFFLLFSSPILAVLPQPPASITAAISQSQKLYGFDQNDPQIGQLMQADGVPMVMFDSAIYQDLDEVFQYFSLMYGFTMNEDNFSANSVSDFQKYLIKDASISKLNIAQHNSNPMESMVFMGHAKQVAQFIENKDVGYAQNADLHHYPMQLIFPIQPRDNRDNESLQIKDTVISVESSDKIRDIFYEKALKTALVMNNSWGMPLEGKLSDIESPPTNSFIGIMKEEFKQFAKHGVIVQALPNNVAEKIF